MGKTRFANLKTIGDTAITPQKGDLLMFSYQPSEKILKVESQLSDNVFLVLSEEENSYVVYVYQPDLLNRFNSGIMSGLAQIGTTQDKIKPGKKLKIYVWKYGADSTRVITSIGTVQSVERFWTSVQSEIRKVTTDIGVFFVMS